MLNRNNYTLMAKVVAYNISEQEIIYHKIFFPAIYFY
jgi:hypothetical protein